MRYTTILFDLDHTLLDSDASSHAAFDRTMKSIGVDPSPALFAAYDRMNQALWRRVEAGELTPQQVNVQRFEQLLDLLDTGGDPDAMGTVFTAGLAEHGELYTGARELLDALDGRVRLGLVTNGIATVQRRRIERLDVDRYFEVISISGELAMSKPGRKIFDHTLAALGADTAGTVMVGDNLGSDIQGGVNAGLDTIWFNPEREHNSSELRPTLEVASLAELLTLLT